MSHKKYNHLPSEDKYLLFETSGTVNRKKIYRSKESDLQNIKNEIIAFKFSKSTHYFNHLLIRNSKANNVISYIYLCLQKFGKIKMNYYQQMGEAVKEINNTKFNCLYITPSIYWNFKDKINLKHYEYIFLAGEQLSKNIKENLLNDTNAIVFDVYGGNDHGFIGYKNVRNHDYHQTASTIRLINNNENKVEFIKKESGACDFIEDENGIQDIRKNMTYIGGDFIEIIDENKFIYLGRDDSFVKINEKKIYLDQVKNFLLSKLKAIDIKLLKYKDENGFDQFCMYMISEKKYEIKKIFSLILDEYNDINHMPKKILISNDYLTKDINSGEIIKTDSKKLLEMVLKDGQRAY